MAQQECCQIMSAYTRSAYNSSKRGHLLKLLEQAPSQPYLLNNLANVTSQLGRPESLEYARQAHQLLPEDAIINDTLGWLLVSTGKPGEGLRYLREANARLADSPELRYHLSVALYHLGRHGEARKELQLALSADTSFPGRKDAEALMEQL